MSATRTRTLGLVALGTLVFGIPAIVTAQTTGEQDRVQSPFADPLDCQPSRQLCG